MSPDTLIFGHRGYPREFPENSLSGFDYAITQHIDGLEFDVQLTKDLVPVVIHDETIDRTTNGQGFVHDMTYRQLCHYRLKDSREHVPTLAQFLELVSNQDVHLNLEFKTNFFPTPGIERIVLNMVANYYLRYPVIYSSFNPITLQRAYQFDAGQQYCLLNDQSIQQPDEVIQKYHLAGFHLNHYQADLKLPQRIWTIDDPDAQAALFQKKVAAIITNNFVTAQMIRASLEKSATAMPE